MRSVGFGLILLLAGCAGPIETRVDSSGANAVQPAKILLQSDVSGPGAEAQMLVSKALTSAGFQIGEPSDFSLHVSVSDRPADLSLSAGKNVLAATPQRKTCAAREYRLGVTMMRITDGTLVYRAHAAEFHCKQTLQQALPFLVDAALKDLGAPRGGYTVKRPR